MGYAFQTPGDSFERITISGVGVLEPAAANSVDVAEAAHELWELQNAEGQPLTGEDLRLAAERFAASRGFNVIEIKTAREESIDDLLAVSRSVAEESADDAEGAPRPAGRRRSRATEEGSDE